MRRFALALLLALTVTGVLAATTTPPATYSDSGPEPQLSRILSEIEQNRLDIALKQTEALLKQYPNFRLAHLIKGDLLQGRPAAGAQHAAVNLRQRRPEGSRHRPAR